MTGIQFVLARATAKVVELATNAIEVAAQAGLLTVTAGAAVTTVGVEFGRLGASFVGPVIAPTGRAASRTLRAGAEAVSDSALGQEVLSLLDPRLGRRHRRVAGGDDRVHVEVRGLTGPVGASVAKLLVERLGAASGVLWSQVNAVTGRVTVGLDPQQRTVADVIAIIRSAEQDSSTDEVPWSRHSDLPGDREPLLAAGLAFAADVAGFAAAVSLRAVPVPAAGKVLTAGLALVDAQPRLRRQLERHLGASRTDLVITLGNASAQAASHGAASLLVDAGQRAAALVELTAARQSWQRWETRLHGPGGISVADPIRSDTRPRPMPAGPLERFADQAATGSLLAAAASLAGRQGVATSADALLVGVPKAARTSRESFASVLSAAMSRQGVLALDSAVWRRLDRVSVLVVDAGAVRGGPPLVLDAECVAEGWTREHLWSAGQRLLRGGTGATVLPVPPPHGRDGARLALSAATGPSGAGKGSHARWRVLLEDGEVVGRVLVGSELHPWADRVLAAARRAGLRVVLAGDVETSELRGMADELIPAGRSLTAAVRRLQREGHGVALLSVRAHRALAAADVAIGVSEPNTAGGMHVPWTADVVCPDLALAARIVAATATARAVSEHGRTLAMSASALGGLLLVAGPSRGVWTRSVSPIAGAALLGLVTGTRSAWAISRPVPAPLVALVPWHGLEPDEVLSRLPTRPESSLADAVPRSRLFRGVTVHDWPAAQRLLEQLDRMSAAGTSLSRHVREELADPLTPVLTVGAVASAILGAPTDAALVGSVMGVNALVAASQRQRADRAMAALRLDERVMARRLVGGGARQLGQAATGWAVVETPAEHLRPGDVIVLAPGNVVPADARLLAVEGLELDESGLTGESVTVDKQVAATPGAPLGERACMVFEGGVVVAGQGRAVVVAVGETTQAGRALAAVPTGGGSSGVQAQLRALTDKALPLTLGGGALVAGLGFLRAQPLRAAVADGVAVAVAAVPEGLPLVATVAQLAAARRLSRRGVLVRSSRTVEALGRVDTMCFDKTGTLTEGSLRLVELADLANRWTPGEAERSADARRLLRAAARACPAPEDGPAVHATDRAVLAAAAAHLGRQATHVWDPVEEVPFESNRGYAATLGQSRSTLRLVVKGAPEVLLPRCTQALQPSTDGTGREVHRLTAADREAALETVHALASQGLRVLVVARRELTEAPEDVEAEVRKLTLMGFIGLADTPRASTLPVVSELGRNGISVRMITGDHPVTAKAIAAQLGIDHDQVVTGADLDAWDDTTRGEMIARSTVFARVSPEQKVTIVAALQRAGRVVAMTGDGSNDAAAIRLADVGIGLAAHGSAAARNAADLVLTEPDLTLLLDALVEGRRMWARVRDAVAILVGGNAGEVVFTVFGTALTGKAPVTARQFLLVNLLTDMFPAMAVAIAHPRPLPRPQEPGEGVIAAEIEATPEQRRAVEIGAELAESPVPELGAALLRSIGVRGTTTAAGASAAWLIGRGTGSATRASTMGLVALVGTQLGQTVLLGGPSPVVWVTAVASGAALIAIVQTPGVSQFFGCTPLDPTAWIVVAGSAGIATIGSVLIPPLVPLLSRAAQTDAHPTRRAAYDVLRAVLTPQPRTAVP